jgi:hypothetical protein
MAHRPAGPLLLPLTFILLAAGSARAGEVEVAPFFGLQYGGSLVAPSGRKVAIDVGPQDGASFLVMEYVEGETLAARLERGAMPVDQALKAGIEIASALAKAHREDLYVTPLEGDPKPTPSTSRGRTSG